MNNMLARFQVLPDGIIIGHVVPTDHPANATGTDLEVGKVYEVNLQEFSITVGKIGTADYRMQEMCSVDNFLVRARGKHLTVDGK